MAQIKRIVTSETEGRVASDRYGDGSFVYDVEDGELFFHPADGRPVARVIGIGVVYGSNGDSGDGYGADTLKLVPDANLNTDQYIVIDPTSPNHIHIRAGGAQDASNADLILGAEKAHVLINDGAHQVVIQTHNTASEYNYNWYFTNEGYIVGPAEGSVQVYGLYNPSPDYAFNISSANKLQLSAVDGVFVGDPETAANEVATLGDLPTGATGSFTSADGKTITVTNGIITAITP